MIVIKVVAVEFQELVGAKCYRDVAPLAFKQTLYEQWRWNKNVHISVYFNGKAIHWLHCPIANVTMDCNSQGNRMGKIIFQPYLSNVLRILPVTSLLLATVKFAYAMSLTTSGIVMPAVWR